MKTLKLTLAAVALTFAATSLASNANANAHRPVTGKPHGEVCMGYLHSNVAKAKKLSKAECLACHEPVRDRDLIYSYAYPVLKP